MDTKKRSWVKSIVWRIVGVVLLGGLSWEITRDLREMTIITALFHSLRFVLYYAHERIWERLAWGKIRHPLSDLPVKTQLSPEDREVIADKLRELGYLD